MSDQETWVQTQENLILFKNKGEQNNAGRLLEISPTNRTIISRDQGVTLAVLNFTHNYFRKLYPDQPIRYSWLKDVRVNVEEYQQTMAGETNSRIQFIKTTVAEFQALWNKATGGKKQDEMK
jgi:hypothetical protein